ncbi:MAG: class II fructose-bisphosphate aldolase [Candidatus Pacebacteria bacterium]|nr:class II fructose-bisphosphate aldolase [Candidatus Paceibacterota bacterium]
MMLHEYIERAYHAHIALGHFNISDLVGLKAIASGARNMSVPVIIGVSEGEREFIGIKQLVALVRSIKDEYHQDIFLNADHTHSFEKIKEAVEAGFDAVLFDGGTLPLDENISRTKEVVEWVKEFNHTRDTHVVVEGELGYIGGGSVILDRIPDGVSIKPEDLTTSYDAKRFVQETGVDLLAPAVGNVHGMFEHVPDPALDCARVKDISDAVRIPLVLHGASGNSEKDIKNVIDSGMAIVHINTELRVAWKRGINMALLSHPNEIAPYKLLPEALHEIQKVVEEKLTLFQNSHASTGDIANNSI